MATPVLMPQLGNSVESCVIVQWLKQPGDSVAQGEALCEIETDKSTMEVEAPEAGVLLDMFFQADDDVPVKTVIAAIGAAGEDVSALRPAGEEDPAAAATPVVEAAAPAAVSVAAQPATAGAATGVSPRARQLAAKEGVDAGSLAGSGPHGRVIERDVQAAVAGRPPLSPAARACSGTPPPQGSGIGGRVLAADMRSGAAPTAVAAEPAAPGTVTETPIKGIRKLIAERMHASLHQTAQLTMNAHARAGAMQALRTKIKFHGEELGLPNITFNDMVLFACSRVLPRHPLLNAHFLGDRILQFADVNLGIAVDTERGLMVPVLPQAQHLSLAQISAAAKPLIKEAQAGSINPDKLQGGTITITNIGAMGVSSFTPVLNAPEVAILGVCAIEPKPYRQSDGSVVFEDAIGFSLTIDHQAVDGAPAARFLADLVKAIEQFDLTMAG